MDRNHTALEAALTAVGIKVAKRRRFRRAAKPKHSCTGSLVPNQRFALHNWAVALPL